ncbi:hypothetical protein ABZ904_50500 [Streptomyces sp. NPDC046900]|uniref:hypothetical protein n=1 Tax=Streptomyces sp. NPDC046900 TaxID=3155473 RepID=UPI0033D57DD3
MSHLAPGIFHGRLDRPIAATAPAEAWQRTSFVFLAVGLDVAAAVRLLSRHLPSAVAGVLLGGLGWFATGRVAAWYPASLRGDLEESVRR